MQIKSIIKYMALMCLLLLSAQAQAMPLVVGTPQSANGVYAYQGDFNGDGMLDFVEVVGFPSSNQVVVSLADGTGSFTVLAAQTFATLTQIASMIVVDMNSDGTLDLVMSDSNGMVYKAMSAGDGTFTLNLTPLLTLSSIPTLEGLDSAWDMNGDGIIDFLTLQGDAATKLKVWLSGGGTYTPSAPIATGGGVRSSVLGGLSVADIDNDGQKDVVVLLPSSIAVLNGQAGGGLAPPVSYTLTNPSLAGVAVADINGDGFMDVLVSGNSNVSTTPDSLSVLLGSASGLGPEALYPMSTLGNLTTFNIGTADFNLDGNLDVAAVQVGSGKLAVLAGDGSGGFLAPVEYTFSANASSAIGLFVGDINGDIKPDVLVRAGPFVTSLKNIPMLNTNTTALIQGAISINANASTTSSVAVNLNLTCQTNTGAACPTSTTMEFSNDGATWTSPAVPWSTTASWTLTSGLGVKTVYVQFTDSAGNVATVNDTIELISPPSNSGGGCFSPAQSSMQLLLLMFAALFAFASWIKRKDT